MSDVLHQCDGESLVQDAIGFYTPRCTCGWSWGQVPDLETLTDVLMAHAQEMGATT